MAKNTTDFNINVVLNNRGVMKGATQTNKSLTGMGNAGFLAGRGINAGMLKAAAGIGIAVAAVMTSMTSEVNLTSMAGGLSLIHI